MNMAGNNSESFDDILKDETQIEQYIPALEAQFIRYYDPYSNVEAFGDAVRQALPALQKSEAVDQRGSGSLAMRLLLVLRAVTPTIRTGILDNIPAPILVMLRNRVMNGPQDEGTKALSDRLKSALDTRTQRGEQFVVPAANRQGITGVATVKGASPQAQIAAPAVSHAGGAAGSPRKEAPTPAPRPERPASTSAGAERAAPAVPAQAPAAASAPAPATTPQTDTLLDQRLLVAWRQDGNQFSVVGLTPRELFGLVGPEPRLVLPWVMLALQTGQVFNFAASEVNKELIEKLVKAVLVKSAGQVPARLGKPQVAQLVNELKDAPPQKALLALVVKGQLGDLARKPGKSSGALDTLISKFGNNLGEFLRSPSKDEFREIRVGLSVEEKKLVQVLQKLARLGV
jgi:hypothetical protein